MDNYSNTHIQLIKVLPNYCVQYNEYVHSKSGQSLERSLSNLVDNSHKNKMSDKSIKRLFLALDWLLLIAKKKTASNLKANKEFQFKVSMLTLTLPCEQLHSDLYVKKYLLNELLTVIRKKYNLHNYIWKAEKQGNGNIHFHIVIDKYIYYADINRIWNKILDTHGYIEQYRRNQEQLHKDGFKIKSYLNKIFSPSAQLAAYKKGVATNWKQPTGTTDIHSLKNIRNAKSYLAKYISKNPDKEKQIQFEVEKYKKSEKVSAVSTSVYNEIVEKVTKNLSIGGHIWFISQSLSKLKGIVIYIDYAISTELNWFRRKKKDGLIYTDFCTIFKMSLKDIFKFKLPKLSEKVQNYITELRNVFYPDDEISYSPLGIPLNIF